MDRMDTGAISKLKQMLSAIRDFLAERGLEDDPQSSRLWCFAHFWLMVAKNFVRNRCLVRASALAYTTLLALVPLLAVGVGVTSSLLKQQGDKPAQELIDRLVAYVAPALNLEAKTAVATVPPGQTNPPPAAVASTVPGSTPPEGRARVVRQITEYIRDVHSGTLTTTSMIALLFVCISMLRTIEAAFNDIWGVTEGRSWFRSIVYYWATITLGPLVLVGAISLTAGGQARMAHAWMDRMPLLTAFLFTAMPYLLLSLGFALFYALMPNTRVRWPAALVGGVLGGCLWQLNNKFSVLYVSQVGSYTSIYGSLGLLPLFLVGLFFSWIIVLFGAQVAYAFQNRQAYIQEKLAQGANQHGREFVALRLMTTVARHFSRGGPPPTCNDLATDTGVPSRLAGQVLGVLVRAKLVMEVCGQEAAYAPARPLHLLTPGDVLQALRSCDGQEFSTKDDAERALVRAEYERIHHAESQAAGEVNFQQVVNRLTQGS